MAKITLDALRKLAPHGKGSILQGIVGPLNKYLPAYGVNTPLRVSHFLAQSAHEADGFKTLTEYASGTAYEGRKNLGNTQPGDGARYKGRGIFQCTGRANYKKYGDRLEIDLIGHPERAAEPEISVRIACEYWKDHKLNALADADDVDEITRRINGGHNGLAERKRYLAVAKKLFAGNDEADAPEVVPLPKSRPSVPDDTGPELEPDPAPAPEPRKKTGITEIGSVGGLGTAADTLSTANDTIRTVNETKENVNELGVGDYLVAMASNPRFLISALFLIGIIGGLVWWQIKKRRAA